MRRQVNYSRGSEAERRVKSYLEVNRGKVWFTIDGLATPKYKVEYGSESLKVDLRILSLTTEIALEVKSSLGVTGGKVGRIRISRTEWQKLKEYCSARHKTPPQYLDMYYALIVEIVVRRAGSIYVYIEGSRIDNLFETKKGRNLSLTIWQILRMGTMI